MVEEADPLLARSPRARSRWTWKIGIAAMVIIGVVFAIAAANAGLRGEIGAAATLGKQPEGTGKKATRAQRRGRGIVVSRDSASNG